MKKLSLLLALLICVSVIPFACVSAETTPGFVIDGKLDQYYRSDEWAEENNCYFYFNGMDDTTLDIVSKEPGAANGVEDLVDFYEAVQVKIYVAYDDYYAYFYVDVIDPNIPSSVTMANGTVLEGASQYLDGIDFYVDTDTMSCDGNFTDNINTYENADCHFRLTAHDFAITDFLDRPKYTLDNEADTTTGAYFKNTDNVYPFYQYDDRGDCIGYGVEARFPLAQQYDSMYSDIYFNIAVNNSPTEKDPTRCAITTGKRWWLAYDTGKTVFLDYPNPFLEVQSSGNLSKVKALIAGLPETPTLEDRATLNEIDALIGEMTDAELEALTEQEYTKFWEVAAAVFELEITTYMGDINMDGSANAGDALMVLKYAVGKEELDDDQMFYADVNVDDRIDAGDALDILKYAVGKLDQFEAVDFYLGE